MNYGSHFFDSPRALLGTVRHGNGRKKMSRLFENLFKKSRKRFFENSLPPPYLLGFRLRSRVAPNT